ncbi:HPt (histidine-containing phosphotransfer) domain-containing protein [Blastomonas natatoria]|uniref:HPt (Histidine-containing phosphotransfer) domain-containing protein n=1 Tax=Blastomonas natatoria TaxID=34015 RepID=A0A2V3V2M2_9SPHN|nr:Hpt domain-containing protein [Blastomonas natatoria]PXW76036.1 HPt (histidine-containing phosphotransfer) domain-containing protein [Blastomonas natatoria]
MAYESGALNAALSAAVGNDPDLVAELRGAFLESAARQIDLLGRARCDANWHFAALRLKSLAASFSVQGIVDLADQALEGAPGDPVVLRELAHAMRDFGDMNGPTP